MNRNACVARLFLAVMIAPLITADVERAHAQSPGCSDLVREAAETGLAADSAGPPFAIALSQRDRLTFPDSTATREQICAMALNATFQNHRSGHRSIRASLESRQAKGRNTSDVQYGFAAIRNQRGAAGAVLADTAVTNSLDPLVRFELSRALFLTGMTDDALNLLRTAVTGDPGAAALFHHFTYPVLSAESRVAIARMPSQERGRRLLEEWERMAWSSGLTTAERLAVHFRRVVHADSMYFGLRMPLADSGQVIASGRAQPDPRREIYIRFGEPARIVRTISTPKGPRLSSEWATWVYADPTQRHPMLFHFSGANGNYGLIVSGGCRLDWLSDRATLSPRIGQVYQACVEKSDFQRSLDQLRRETLAEYAKNRDREFVVPSRLGARFVYRLYTFRDPATLSPEVVAVAHVPAEEIPRSGSMRAGVFLRSERGEMRSRMVEYRATQAGDAMIVLTIPGVSAGDYSYRIRTSDLEFQEGFVYGGEQTVRLNGTGQMTMSDLVIATPDSAGPLRRSDQALRPILGAVSEDMFDLYGEVYGIPAGEPVDVEITISRKRFLRKATAIAVKFTDTTRDDGQFVFRQLIQHDLEPGDYEITVKLHNDRAGIAEQTMTVEIRKPGN